MNLLQGDTDMELFEGRPTDCQGRLAKEIRVYDFLDPLGIKYQRIYHEALMAPLRPARKPIRYWEL